MKHSIANVGIQGQGFPSGALVGVNYNNNHQDLTRCAQPIARSRRRVSVLP